MRNAEKEISKEIYDRARGNGGRLLDSDMTKVFSIGLLMGYGVYDTSVYQVGDKYYVGYEVGESCD